MLFGIETRWFIPGVVVLAVLGLLLVAGRTGQPANAQPSELNLLGNEILVIPIQLERDMYGIAMVDKLNQTIWVYELNSRVPAYNRLRLLAARSWRYDRLLQQYNTAEPKPEQVRIILETISKQMLQEPEQTKQQDSNNILPTPQPNDVNLSQENVY